MFATTQEYVQAVTIEREIQLQQLTRAREAMRLAAEDRQTVRRRWQWPGLRSLRAPRVPSWRGA